MMEGNHSSIVGTLQRVYASGGILGFYRGLSVTLVRSVPVACTVLPMFDYVHEKLSQFFLEKH